VITLIPPAPPAGTSYIQPGGFQPANADIAYLNGPPHDRGSKLASDNKSLTY